MTHGPMSKDERNMLRDHALTWFLGFGFGVGITLIVVLGLLS